MGVILLETLKTHTTVCTPHTHGGDSYTAGRNAEGKRYSPYTWG